MTQEQTPLMEYLVGELGGDVEILPNIEITESSDDPNYEVYLDTKKLQGKVTLALRQLGMIAFPEQEFFVYYNPGVTRVILEESIEGFFKREGLERTREKFGRFRRGNETALVNILEGLKKGEHYIGLTRYTYCDQDNITIH